MTETSPDSSPDNTTDPATDPIPEPTATGAAAVPAASEPQATAMATAAAIPISEAESAVMQVLWQRSPLGADEIVAHLALERAWGEATIKTLINRLLKKGAVSATAQGRRYLYAPVLARADWLNAQSTGLLARLFGGRVAPLVAHFGAQGALSAQDIAKIKQLIAELDK